MARGSLRIYLGAAPGVGKTYAMLNEGNRRADRGADVVIGIAETHQRVFTEQQLGDLPIIPRRRVAYRDTVIEEMDVDAILARRPKVVLVDEYAHTNAPGSRNEKRWEDIEELLDAGIDVISTLNIQHLESLNDVVARITGITQQETVPDAIVRRADQFELVDITPEALRRRMAHGNIYAPERIDAALGNYFRPGNLGALRELALLWVAGQVEDKLSDYLDDHGITQVWETRERVVVGITGAPAGDRLIRRAARMAGRVGGDLIGVHVAVGDGLARDSGDALDGQRKLVRELGGTVHEVVGHSTAEALVGFARAEKATQLVVGSSRRSRWFELWHGSFVASVSRLARGIDVHVISNDGDGPTEQPVSAARARPAVERRRDRVAWGITIVGLPLLTAAAVAVRNEVALSTVLLVFLAVVVGVSALGGRVVGAVAAIASSLLVNWFMVEPHRTLTISEPENIVSLVVFVAVGVTVGWLVDVASRRGAESRTARAEAEALARAAADLSAGPEALPELVDHIRTTFALDGIRIRDLGRADIPVVAESGTFDGEPTVLVPVRRDAATAAGYHLDLFGRTLSPDDQRVLRVLADQLTVAIENQRLARDAADATLLAHVDAVRTALLRAVSHDLRTPLASIKAMVSGLRDQDVAWTAEQLAEGLATIDSETDRLNRLVGNLLDASRLQAGAVGVHLRPTDIAETVLAAVDSIGTIGDSVVLDLSEELPLLSADPALLERAIANLLSNAVRFSTAPGSVRVTAERFGDDVQVRVIDRGPGIPDDQHAKVLAPFQRLGDHPSPDGVGLGLPIAQGFVEAMGGTMSLDDTPGGGLTVTISMPTSVPSSETPAA
jgi:two-component system sensor histidine kinase KdpD